MPDETEIQMLPDPFTWKPQLYAHDIVVLRQEGIISDVEARQLLAAVYPDYAEIHS